MYIELIVLPYLPCLYQKQIGLLPTDFNAFNENIYYDEIFFFSFNFDSCVTINIYRNTKLR